MARTKKNREETMSAENAGIMEPMAGEDNTSPVEHQKSPEEKTAPEEVTLLAPEPETTESAETGETAFSEPERSTEDDGVINLTLSLPVAMFEQSPGSMQRLKAAISSKQTLLKKALGADSLDVVIEEDRVTFPWFTTTEANSTVEVDAYSKLVFALAKKAIMQTRIDPVEKVPEDLRLGMNHYLTHLDFKGAEYKSARAVLMKNFKATNGPVLTRKTDFILSMPEVYKP